MRGTPRIEAVRRAIEPLRVQLLGHELYEGIRSVVDLRVFMEHHVFAVWDFVCILKALQQELSCVTLPWRPRGDPESRRLINEIVLAEESDLDGEGGFASHFELYRSAMLQSGADVSRIDAFLAEIERGTDVREAMSIARVPLPARRFVESTWTLLEAKDHRATAAVFAFGREALIPHMFEVLIAELGEPAPGHVTRFHEYLSRHLHIDRDQHTPMAFRLVEKLCGDDPEAWQRAELAASRALEARLGLWTEIASCLGNRRRGAAHAIEEPVPASG